MTNRIAAIGLDADDTLWHNERFFRMTHARFAELLADHADTSGLMARLESAERRNLGAYGFGIKGFVLSMIETALEVTDGRVPGTVIAELMAAGREMLAHPIELLPGVAEAVGRLSADHRLILITKGDLLDQERKIAQSGLGEAFHAVEIVSHKTPAIYAAIFARHGEGAARALMAGNSMASDVLPMLQAGGHAAHVPHDLTWSLEVADPPQGNRRFHALETLGELPDLVERIEAGH
jgi:putative hydrolase of the HAD superfamily